MNPSNSPLAALLIFAFSGCGKVDQAPVPHQIVTLIAGVRGHLETCRSLLADKTLSSKEVLEFAPLGRSFVANRTFPAGASPKEIDQLTRSESELSDCIKQLEARAGIRAPAR